MLDKKPKIFEEFNELVEPFQLNEIQRHVLWVLFLHEVNNSSIEIHQSYLFNGARLYVITDHQQISELFKTKNIRSGINIFYGPNNPKGLIVRGNRKGFYRFNRCYKNKPLVVDRSRPRSPSTQSYFPFDNLKSDSNKKVAYTITQIPKCFYDFRGNKTNTVIASTDLRYIENADGEYHLTEEQAKIIRIITSSNKPLHQKEIIKLALNGNQMHDGQIASFFKRNKEVLKICTESNGQGYYWRNSNLPKYSDYVSINYENDAD